LLLFRTLHLYFYNLLQIELFRRQQEREMIHHERERDRERDERETQRRVEAELAQRNFERDRMEQLRIAYPPRNHPYNTGRQLDDPTSQQISVQHLMNAIITENIRPSESRERYVNHFQQRNNQEINLMKILQPTLQREHLSRLQQQAAENNGNSHSPNVINVDVDSSSDLSRHPSSTSGLPPKLKLNDLTDAIIAKDPSFGMQHHQGPAYHLPPSHYVRTAFNNAVSIPSSIASKAPPPIQVQSSVQSVLQPMGQEQIIATDQWNLKRRLQQKEEMAKSGGHPQGRSTPDDRNVIRMSQTPSPRNKMQQQPYEPVSPPESSSVYHQKIPIGYDQRGGMQMQQEKAPGPDGNKLLNMLHQRIAEVMRSDDHSEGGKERRDGDIMKGYERPRSGNSAGPGNGVDGGDKSPANKRESPQVYMSRPSSQPGNQPQYQPSPSMPFMYPYNALTIPQAAGPNPIISPKSSNEILEANRQHLETTRQVMSDNYDALSDDEN
jgi:hypothetical protein